MKLRDLQVSIQTVVLTITFVASGAIVYAELNNAVAQNTKHILENDSKVQKLQSAVTNARENILVNQAILIRIEKELSNAKAPR